MKSNISKLKSHEIISVFSFEQKEVADYAAAKVFAKKKNAKALIKEEMFLINQEQE